MTDPKYPSAVFVCHDIYGNPVDCYDSMDAAQETGSRMIRRYVDAERAVSLAWAQRDLRSLADAVAQFVGEHGYESYWVSRLEAIGLTIDDEGFVREVDRSACTACDIEEAAPGVDYGREHTCGGGKRKAQP